MKKIITAIGNPTLNVYLKRENEFEVMSEDIQYQDGIFEFLEKEPNINFIILSELIPGNLEIKNLIEKIKLINNNIQIILFLEKENKELENYLYAKGINFIFYNNEIEIKEIVQIIKTNQKEENNDLKKEIVELKKLLEEKNEKSNVILENTLKKEKLINIYNKFFSRKKTLKEKTKEIICVSGTSGVGKSIFTVNLAKSINKNKILIIDFDVLNNSLHTILGVKKYSEKIVNKMKNKSNEIKIEELIIKINSKIDLISGVNLLFNSNYKINNEKIKNILDTLAKNYNVIIIDTSSECFLDFTKEIMKLSNLNIFISETNLLQIKKAKNLLNIYINKWKIPIKSFYIIFNKYDVNSIDFSILKNVFSDFNVLGKLNNDSNYNLIINKNAIGNINRNLQKEYLKLYKNLIKN